MLSLLGLMLVAVVSSAPLVELTTRLSPTLSMMRILLLVVGSKLKPNSVPVSLVENGVPIAVAIAVVELRA